MDSRQLVGRIDAHIFCVIGSFSYNTPVVEVFLEKRLIGRLLLVRVEVSVMGVDMPFCVIFLLLNVDSLK